MKFLFSVLFVLLVAACGGGDSPTAIPNAPLPFRLASPVSGDHETVLHLYQALYGKAPSNPQLNTFKSQITSAPNGAALWANALAVNLSNLSNRDFASLVLKNISITPTSLVATALFGTSQQAYDGLLNGFVDYLSLVGSGNRGVVAAQLTKIISTLEIDTQFGVYGSAATALNKQIGANDTYSSNPNNVVESTVSGNPGGGGPTSGSGGSSPYVPPANLGTLNATGGAAAQFGAVFAPVTLTSQTYFGLGWQYDWKVSDTHFVRINGSTVAMVNGNQILQKSLTPSSQLMFNAPAGTVSFTSLTTAGANPLILNGTLQLVPLNSGPVTVAGTGTGYAGTGFDAPVATFTAPPNGTNVYTWVDNRGSTIKLTRILPGESYQVSLIAMADLPYLTTNATLSALGVTLNTANKTVTFANTALTNNNTRTAITISGTLSIP